MAATWGPEWLSARYTLIAINVAVFLMMLARGVSFMDPKNSDLISWGADFGPYIFAGQYWRIFTSAFLHIGILHLAMNMVSLWIVARPVERLFGKTMTFVLYLLTGAGASMLDMSWEPMRISAGASGALFGFLGIIISFFQFARLDLPPEQLRSIRMWAMQLALINLVLGLSAHVANMAHLGGLVTGLLIGIFLGFTFRDPVEDHFPRQVRVSLVAAVLLAGVFALIAHAKVDIREIGKGDKAMDRHDYPAAILHYQKASALRPRDPDIHASAGNAFYNSRQWKSAQEEYERALSLGSQDHWVQLNLANVYFRLNEPQKAVPLYHACILFTTFDSHDYVDYGSSLRATGDLRRAESMFRKSIELDPAYFEPHSQLADLYEDQGRDAESEREQKIAKELLGKHPL